MLITCCPWPRDAELGEGQTPGTARPMPISSFSLVKKFLVSFEMAARPAKAGCLSPQSWARPRDGVWPTCPTAGSPLAGPLRTSESPQPHSQHTVRVAFSPRHSRSPYESVCVGHRCPGIWSLYSASLPGGVDEIDVLIGTGPSTRVGLVRSVEGLKRID